MRCAPLCLALLLPAASLAQEAVPAPDLQAETAEPIPPPDASMERGLRLDARGRSLARWGMIGFGGGAVSYAGGRVLYDQLAQGGWGDQFYGYVFGGFFLVSGSVGMIAGTALLTTGGLESAEGLRLQGASPRNALGWASLAPSSLGAVLFFVGATEGSRPVQWAGLGSLTVGAGMALGQVLHDGSRRRELEAGPRAIVVPGMVGGSPGLTLAVGF